MTNNQNKDIEKNVVDSFKLQRNVVQVPTEIGKLTPVVDVKPIKTDIMKSGSGTIYTTPTDKDFYLTGVFMNGMVNSGSTSSTSNTITITKANGEEQTFKISFVVDTLAPTTQAQEFIFPPLLLKRGTNITSTAGSTIFNQQICGFIEMGSTEKE